MIADRPGRIAFAREQEIASLAEHIATERFPDGRVEPEQIAAQERIAFRYAAFHEDFDGILVHDAGQFFIICNDRLTPRGSPRSRFTFAHELGHYFVDDHRRALAAGTWPAHYSRADFRSDAPLEMEADLFAGNLLLPRSLFQQRAAALDGPGLERIATLASHFGASLTATAYRALGLGIFAPPAAVFRWNALGERAGRRMSEETAALGREYLGMADCPPADSVTARAIAGLEDGTLHGQSHMMNWFPKLSGYGDGDQILLREEVKSLGDFGWLTLVHAETQ